MFLRVASAVLALVLAACGGVESTERAVEIEFDGCGDAFDGRVAGAVVAEDRIVTVAHAVWQAEGIRVTHRGRSRPGTVVALDRGRDLALLAVPGLGGTSVGTRGVDDGAPVTVVGGLASGTVEGLAVRTVDVRIEEALGSERVVRRGLELDVAVRVGDSGSGVFADDMLVGVVFAVDETGSAWAVAAEEVDTVLSAAETPHVCVPSRSRLEPAP